MIKITISKDEIANMPQVVFPGRIHVIESASHIKIAINHLRKHKIVGFDTETRPSFTKGKNNKMALMQLSTDEDCFLIRINKTGITKILKNFLEDKNVLKIGLSLKDDFGTLKRSHENINPEGFYEIQTLAQSQGISDISLQKIFAILFEKRISKKQRLSNWEAQELTMQQIEYAAIDAWACLMIYNHLMAGKFDPKTTKYLKDIPDPIIDDQTDKEK